MADVLTKTQRSFNMSRIRSRDTKPEMLLRRLLFKKKVMGYRVHYGLAGRPDIVFPSKKVAVFVDGCFWHKCPECFVEPETRKKFWLDKINGNVKRDVEVTDRLVSEGWKVLRYWEHEVRKNTEDVAAKIISVLKQC